MITHYLEEMASCDVLNVLIAGKLYYSGNVSGFIKEHSTTNLQILLKESYSVQALEIAPFINKSTVVSNREILISDVTVDEIMQIISDNHEKSIIESFNVAYSNLETAYLNLLKEKDGESNV